jgi:hypothetical protein
MIPEDSSSCSFLKRPRPIPVQPRSRVTVTVAVRRPKSSDSFTEFKFVNSIAHCFEFLRYLKRHRSDSGD